MRTSNSIKNIIFSISSQLIIIILGFLSRKAFLDNLEVEYLGINGLLTNVLSMLSLVEGGIGISIVYNLYKPLAENHKEKVIALVQLYKKVYIIIAIIVFLLSLILYPFIETFVKDVQSVSNITIIYFLFVFKNIISYLNAHKWSLINADQKGYILTFSNLLFQVITTVSKIIVLLVTSNYIIYLIIELIIYIIQNLINGVIVNKRYSYLRTKEKYYIDSQIKNNIISNVKALCLHSIGGYIVFGTDNILISTFVSVGAVGLYSNYTMVIGQLSSLLVTVLNGIGASIGNLIATETQNKNYFIFNIAYLINFWIYSFCTIFLYNLLEPFINFWIGEGYLLDKFTFIIILINFYISGLRNSIGTFKIKAGLFQQDKYMPLIEALINLVMSIVLGRKLGLAGIFLGTTVSSLATVFWNVPRIVYKNVFNQNSGVYFVKYFYYTILTISCCWITAYICKDIQGYNFISLVMRGIICLIIPNLLYLLIFFRTKEFQYLLSTIKYCYKRTQNINFKVKMGIKTKISS